MRDIIVLVGQAAAGKDLIEEMLETVYGVRRLVSHTSRPMREGEIEGKNYYFVSSEELLRMVNNDETVEQTTYVVDGETWYYALSKEEIGKITKGKLGVVTVNPHGLKQLLAHKDIVDRMKVIYLRAEHDVREQRYMLRGNGSLDTKRQWEQRVIQDDKDFTYLTAVITKMLKEQEVPLITLDNNGTVDSIFSKVVDSLELN